MKRGYCVCVCVLLAVALRTAVAEPASAWCSADKTCVVDSDCVGFPLGFMGSTSACCGGECVQAYPQKGLGELCDSGCGGQCYAGSCTNGRCERSGFSVGCACWDDSECATASICFGFTNTTQGTCISSAGNLPAGAACVSNVECTTGDCTNNVCVGVAQGDTCGGAYTYVCDAPLRCIRKNAADDLTCTTPQSAAGGYCENNAACDSLQTDPEQRLTCNHTANACILRYSGQVGQTCDFDVECSTKLCSGGICVPRHSVSNGQECYHRDDACRPGSACVGTGATSTCETVSGDSCALFTQGVCGGNTAECRCIGSHAKCQTVNTPNFDQCEEERADYYAQFVPSPGSQISLVAPDPAWYYLSDDLKAVVMNYVCCQARQTGSGEYAFTDAGQTEAIYSIDCTKNPHEMVLLPTEADSPRCTLAQVTAAQDLIKGAQLGEVPENPAELRISPANTLTPAASLALTALLGVALACFL